MKQIIVSKTNLASFNIGKILSKQYGLKLTETELGVLALEPVIDLNAELVIVASSHKSVDGRPTLTCHTTGNWGKAELGGKDETLSVAPALYLREALLELKKQQETLKLNYEVSLEATHHGPSLDAPIIFVEVGSSEKQWKDLKACSAVAAAINRVYKISPENIPVAIGFGGGHYCTTFTKRVLEGKIAFGHICPKHFCDSLDKGPIKQAVEKTFPHPDFAVLEWKGLSAEQRQKLMAIFEKNKIRWKKDKELKS